MYSAVLSAILVAFAAGLMSQTKTPAPRVTVNITVRDSPAKEPALAELVASARDESGALLREVHKVTIPCVVAVALRPGLVWSIELHSDQYWASKRSVFVEAETHVVLSAVPTGTLHARLAFRVGESADAVTVWCWSAEPRAAGQPLEPLITNDSCVRTDEEVSCRVPAGTVDVRLGSSGFIPRYYWSVEVPPHGSVQLGELGMQRGGSVSGWCAGMPPGGRVVATLIPASTGRPAEVIEEDRVGRRSLSAPVSQRGFFQIAGVPPGEFEIQATATGLTSARLGVSVMGENESRLTEVLALRPPASLEVRLEPVLDPDGEAWHIGVLPAPGEPRRRDDEHSAAASAQGDLTLLGLLPGKYLLFVEDGRGNQWLARTVDLEGVMIELVVLPLVEVEGFLKRKGIGVSGTVAFSDRQGLRRFKMASSPDGSFQGYLPEEGRWRVAVVAGSAQTQVGAVDVRVKPGSSRARVEIDLANSMLRGVVVDTREQPVAGAMVTVRHKGGPRVAEAASAADGTVEFGGLEEGEYLLIALARMGSSAPTSAKVLEGEEASVRLVVLPSDSLRGMVVGPRGPVSGAAVVGLPRSPAGSAGMRVIRETTRSDGSFEARVPAGTAAVDLLVKPPGMGGRLMLLPMSEGPVVITVTDSRSTVRISGPHGGIFLTAGSASLPLSLVLQDAQALMGGTTEVTYFLPMEADRYGLCVATSGGERCIWGVALSSSEVVLDTMQLRKRPDQPSGVAP